MAGDSLAPADLWQTAPVVTQRPGDTWKPVAIALAVLLAAVLITAALVATGVMQLGFSLL